MSEYVTEFKWSDGTIQKRVWQSVICKDKIHVFDGCQTVCGLASFRHRFGASDSPITCERCIGGINQEILNGLNNSIKKDDGGEQVAIDAQERGICEAETSYTE